MPIAIHKRALERAIQIAGGPEQLARKLKVTPELIALWSDPRMPIPGDVFLRLVDFFVTDSLAGLRGTDDSDDSLVDDTRP